jgi:hypothetical protein
LAFPSIGDGGAAANLRVDAEFSGLRARQDAARKSTLFRWALRCAIIPKSVRAECRMPKEKFKQQQMRARIAAIAARIMAEDGIEDFAMAKRKAARQLGAGDTQSLPNNDEIETALRVYQSLYQGEEQRERIRYLRSQALAAMEQLAEFKPYLTGPVLKGTAGRYADIDLQVFADSGKEVEIFLLNRNIPYQTAELRHYCGNQERAVSLLSLDWHGTPVRVAVYWPGDERRSVKTSPLGRPLERAGLDAVRTLVASGE